jgi:hypothetical protein
VKRIRTKRAIIMRSPDRQSKFFGLKELKDERGHRRVARGPGAARLLCRYGASLLSLRSGHRQEKGDAATPSAGNWLEKQPGLQQAKRLARGAPVAVVATRGLPRHNAPCFRPPVTSSGRKDCNGTHDAPIRTPRTESVRLDCNRAQAGRARA